MSFAHVWLLLFAIAPLVWIAYEWRKTQRRVCLLLKGLSLLAVALALAEPAIRMPDTKTAAVVLVDTSASITSADMTSASAIVSQISRRKHGNWMRVVPFAREPRDLSPAETSNGLHFVRMSREASDGTNFERALVDGVAAIPAGYIPRIVLISDGNNNEGSAVRAIAELQALHVPVDTIPLAGQPKTGLRLLAVSMPPQAYAGEQIPIDLTIASPRSAQGSIIIFADNKALGVSPIHLESGNNAVRVHARVKSSGAVAISGKISAQGLGSLSFEQALELQRAKILYLSQDPLGADSNLLQVFQKTEYDVTRDPSLLNKDLSGIQLIVLNNLDLNSIGAAAKRRIEEYVKNGGGLLLVGGERQRYKFDRQADALDRVLPAKLAPPQVPHGLCVALIIDKSSSMEGRKIELARLSAIGVVEHLKPSDLIGVLIFDNSFQWAVPMRRAQDKPLIERLISGITPDGGTQIAPALAEAYRKVLPSRGTFKHIVLLTDGISEEGDSIELAAEAAQHDVTISTVGLGQDVNRSYLEKIAAVSGGKSYFLNEPQGLEQILLKDVENYSGTTAVEKSLKPVILNNAEILNGVDINHAPPLKGYARYEAKPSAETILAIGSDNKDPLYVRWQYGLGRVAVFTSDAKSRWAASWVTWPGFDKFWSNATRDLLAHTDQGEATARFDPANGDVVVDYRLGAGVAEPETPPQVFAIGPSRFEKQVDVHKLASRTYRGRLHIGNLAGLFRIRPVQESRAFPEVGLYRQQKELQDYGTNEHLLMQIAHWTGGHFNPSPSSIFDSGGRLLYSNWRLWPGLLGLAVALTIAELIVRKWRGILDGLRRSGSDDRLSSSADQNPERERGVKLTVDR